MQINKIFLVRKSLGEKQNLEKKSFFSLKILFLFFLFLFSFMYSQAGGNGTIPVFGKEWRKIASPEYDLYYPKEFEEMAQRITWYLEYVQDQNYKHLGHTNRNVSKTKKRNVPILINNYSSSINALVFPAPMMSIFWNNFAPLGSGVSWFRGLTSHEGRHLGQFQIQKSLNHTDFNFFLEFDYLLLSSPIWFFEGDAVIAETIFTDGGRGRNPNFDAYFRAMILENPKKAKDYFKTVMGFDEGTTRAFNLYVYGYHISAYLHRKYGKDIIAKILKDLNSSTLILPNLWMVISQYTKMPLEKLYEKVVDDLYEIWSNQQKQLKITPITQITPKEKYNRYIDYRIIGKSSEEGVYILKKDIQHKRADLLKLKNNKFSVVKRLPRAAEIFYDISDYFSVGGTKFATVRLINDIARKGQNRGTRAVKVVDNTTKKQYDIDDQNYYTAILSKDGEKMAMAYVEPNNNIVISIYDFTTKKTVKTFPMGIENEVVYISWVDSENIVFNIFRSDKNDFVIMKMNIISGGKEVLLNLKKDDFAIYPQIINDTLFYISSYSGRNNIYAVNLATKQKYRVTSRPHSITHFVVDKDEIIFDDLTYTGFNVVKIKNDSTKWQPIDSVKRVKAFLYEDLVEGTKGVNLSKMPLKRPKDYASEPYNWFLNPLYFNKFVIFTLGNNEAKNGKASTELGASWQIKDLFDTTSLKFSGAYGLQGTYNIGADLNYAAFYPIFNGKIHYYNRSDKLPNFTYSGSMIIPLDFSDLSFAFNNTFSFSLAGFNYVDSKQLNPVISYINNITDYEIYTLSTAVAYGIPNQDISYLYGRANLNINLDRLLYTHSLSLNGKVETQLDREVGRYANGKFTTKSLLGAPNIYDVWLTDETFQEERFLALVGAKYSFRLFEINLPILWTFYLKNINADFGYKGFFTKKTQNFRTGGGVYLKMGIYPLPINIKAGYVVFYDLSTHKTHTSIFLGM